MKIELVVFDMAGTTIDEQNVVYQTVRRAINESGYNFSQEQVQTAGAGKEKSQAIRDVLALDGTEHSHKEVATIFGNFKVMLAEAYHELDIQPQPGTLAVFEALHTAGVKVVLDTGYDRQTAEGLVAKLGWQLGRDIDALVTASDVINGRPHADMIQLAMSQVGVTDPDKVAKIGDSVIDIEEGQNASCGFTFGITTGAQTREQLLQASPTSVVDSLAEMLDLLR
ncbi:MAG: phosphonatase-like hydrolase [Akkermansiaceae bacterium]|jgi:phosphonatase-like hydrolase